jgi:hypothetical protein
VYDLAITFLNDVGRNRRRTLLARGEPVGERPGRFRQPGQQIAGPRTVLICGYSLLLPIPKIAWCSESRKLRLSFKGSRICFGSSALQPQFRFLWGKGFVRSVTLFVPVRFFDVSLSIRSPSSRPPRQKYCALPALVNRRRSKSPLPLRNCLNHNHDSSHPVLILTFDAAVAGSKAAPPYRTPYLSSLRLPSAFYALTAMSDEPARLPSSCRSPRTWRRLCHLLRFACGAISRRCCH